MTTLPRRTFVELAAATAAIGASATVLAQTTKPAALTSLTKSAKPITPQERLARLAKVQFLMQQQKVGALLIEPGASLEYFTGIRWWRSERTTAVVMPAEGGVTIVAPFFEEPSVRETLQVPGDVRPRNADESPFDLLARVIRERGTAGPLAMEGTTRFFIVVSGPQGARRLARSRGRRPHRSGLSRDQIASGARADAGRQRRGAIGTATRARSNLGRHDGCRYHAQTPRTWVFGEPTPRQREVWNTVKQGQELALATAKIGVPVGAIDRAVRAFYEGKGWGKDYTLPGTSHRTEHGIGTEVHETPYLVRNDETPLVAGRCASSTLSSTKTSHSF